MAVAESVPDMGIMTKERSSTNEAFPDRGNVRGPHGDGANFPCAD